ncbi:MAG: tetratricopeptide repeat protein [Candidatus Eisenbacteria bacterium]
MELFASLVFITGPVILGVWLSMLGNVRKKTKIGVWIACGFLCGMGVYQLVSDWRESKEQEVIADYYRQVWEKDYLIGLGRTEQYVDALGDNPLLQDWVKQGHDYYQEHRFREAIAKYWNCLDHPLATAANIAAARVLIGNCYYSISDLAKAEHHYKEALKMARTVKDEQEGLRAASAALCNLGLVCHDSGRPEDGLSYHQEALEANRRLRNERGVADNLGNMGYVYFVLGKFDKSRQHFEWALEIYRKIPYEIGEACELTNVGQLYRYMGRPEDALGFLNDALELHRKLDYDQGEAGTLKLLALVYHDQDRFEKALGCVEQALEIERGIGHEQGIAAALCCLGIVHHDLGDLEEALRYLEQALEIDRKIGCVPGVADDLRYSGLVYRDQGRLEEASRYLEEALETDRVIRFEFGIAEDLRGLGIVRYDQGRLEEALSYLEEAMLRLESMGTQLYTESVREAVCIIRETVRGVDNLPNR